MTTIHLTPAKDTYTAIKADVDANASVKELVDNIIDNAQRRDRDTVTAELAIKTTSDGAPELVIKDNSGGLAKDELSMVLGLGQSEKDDIEGSIGAFGIGAKKALMCLGNRFTVRSRHADAETGYEYTVGPDWFEDDEKWTVPADEVDMESGTTEIVIQDLNISWPDVRDDLAADLRRTYELYLRGEAPVTLRLLFPDETSESTTALAPPARVSYSFTPWDGFWPRQYQGIRLDIDGVDAPVHMNVEVGLLVSGDKQEGGVDWVCQHRVVERANRDEVSGFGDELPVFDPSSGHKRLKAQVELYTPGDASVLPWNSDKSRIRQRHAVTEAARQELKKVLNRYMNAALYGSHGGLHAAFLEPYTAESRYAANNGQVEVVALGSRYERLLRGDLQQVQIREKPVEGFPDATDMEATAEAHAQLGIKYEYLDWVKPWMRPTYQALVEAKRDDDGCFEALAELETSPPNFTVDGRNSKSERTRLADLARTHVNQGVRYTGLAEWERPRYEFELEKAAENRDISVDDLTPVDELPDDPDQEESEDDDPDGASVDLTIGPFTEDDLAVMRDHLGEFEEYSPEKRKEVLIEHFRRLNMAGVRFEASAD